MSLIIIIIFIVLSAISFSLASSRRLRLNIDVHMYLEKYEYQDFETVGRIKKDYCGWKDRDEITLPVTAKLSNLTQRLPFLLKASYELEFQIRQLNIPNGYEVFLKQRGSPTEYSERYPMPAKCNLAQNKEVTFDLVIRKIDSTHILNQPKELIVELRGSVKQNQLIPFKPISSSYMLDVFIGPELGKVWVSFDPGTIGSCICAGSSQELKIHMEHESDKTARVTPSIITFNTELEPEDIYIEKHNKSTINEDIYLIGDEAKSEMRLNGRVSFQSIKKMLGYRDEYHVLFKNGREINVRGVILSELLVKGIFKQFKNYLEKYPNKHAELLINQKFSPQRAVVAIPNGFTAVQIKDMIQCVDNLNYFKEIRYITEAESILCYYIFNRFQLNSSSKQTLDETIMVFDMGGATINATIADVYQPKDENQKALMYYNVSIDSQIGYRVGGDTIDYCIAKTFLSFKDEIPDFREIDPFEIGDLTEEERKNRAKKIQSYILEVKKLMIDRYYGTPLIMKGNRELVSPPTSTIQDFVETLMPKSEEGEFHVLLTPAEISDFISKILGKKVIINSESEIFQQFCSNGVREYPIFKNDYFQKYVYLPIREATEDALKQSEGEGGFLDTVIFTGRSCMFPRIKETAIEVVRQVSSKLQEGKKINPTFIRGLGGKELKTAVVQGACYYGMYNAIINLSPEKVNSTIGVKRTLSANKSDFEFYELITAGVNFSKNGHTNSVRGFKSLSDAFRFDGTYVNFFQISGRDPVITLKEDMRHKYSKISSMPLHIATESFGAEIFQNGFIETFVNTIDGKNEIISSVRPDQEVGEANDEHYTWVVG